MHRSRSLTTLVGALLALFTLYTLFGASRLPSTRIVETEKDSHTPLPDLHNFPPIQQETSEDLSPDDAFNLPLYPEQHKNHDPVSTQPAQTHTSPSHPIESLIKAAEEQFEETRLHETHNIQDAAAAYRSRRGRHPPPGFDLWYKYATENNAVMVEEYFDQIYHDLNPFWAIKPIMIRTQARAGKMAVEIKDGRAKGNNEWFWCEIWGKMINATSDYLPDMVVPVNEMDESRLLVNWDTINEYMKVAEAEKKTPPADQMVNKYKGWDMEAEKDAPEHPDAKWNGFNVYKYARNACPPSSAARQVGGILSPERILGDFHKDASNQQVSRYFDGRFVSNYTEATDYCSDASIGGLHGALMLPFSTSVSDVLSPMFGGSKFHVNNEILLPAPMYWNDELRFGGAGNGDEITWNSKSNTAIWRGHATGGRSKPYTWYLFHRHRFVALTNSTKYSLASSTSDPIFSPFFREGAIKHLDPATQTHLADWLNTTNDVSFTNLVCDEVEHDGGCWYLNDEFAMSKQMDFVDHFTHRYLPDIDGNSFSGRYRAFLLSNSLPIKATIYREWHDSRLQAWKHFIPMNNRFSDYYSIIEYFIGSQSAGLPGHDEVAQKIASEGRSWAEKVLRKVDMQIYVGRLLLEYARITDDNRANMGWVEDLLSSPGA